MDSNRSFLERAVLLYGPRKAGTSLVHNLLDGGSELLMLPGELKLNSMTLARKNFPASEFAKAYLEKGRLDFPALFRINGTTPGDVSPRPEYQVEGLDKEQTTALLDTQGYVARLAQLLESRPEDFGTLIRHDVAAFRDSLRGSARRDYQCWAAKDVGGRSERVISFYRETFPAGKIVFIGRQPQFVVRSIVLDRRRKGREMKWREVWTECLKAQGLINYLWQQQQAANPSDTFVIYEKLTEQTETEMRRIAAHIGIPFEPILCEPTTLGQPVVVRTSSHKTTKVFKQENSWKKDLAPAQANAIATFFRLAPLVFKRKKQSFTPYSALKAQN
jgi:hypothetical protein